MKVDILWANDISQALNYAVESRWQTKSFKDENAAIQWIRSHRDNIFGINHEFGSAKVLNHYEIAALLRKGGE